jgi:predicted RNA polymerase sigma factor
MADAAYIRAIELEPDPAVQRFLEQRRTGFRAKRN